MYCLLTRDRWVAHSPHFKELRVTPANLPVNENVSSWVGVTDMLSNRCPFSLALVFPWNLLGNAYFATNNKWWRGCLKPHPVFYSFYNIFVILKDYKGSSSFQIHFRDRNKLFCLLLKSLFAFKWVTSKIGPFKCVQGLAFRNYPISSFTWFPPFSQSGFKIRVCLFLL